MQTRSKGFALISVVIFSGIGITIVFGFVAWALSSYRLSTHVLNRERAEQIAEAGVEYYRWHLAHSSSDFQDGTGQAGPYVHDFYDRNDQKIGEFELTITPPATGSTVVTITSTGSLVDEPDVTRTIRTQLAIPSFAKWAVVANDVMRFGEGTETYGPIHSNNGIRFDGIAHNVITSALSSYDDPDHNESGADTLEYGVHTHAPTYSLSAESPLPTTAPIRNDVFLAGRQFPVPATDFVGISSDLSQIKTQAQASGAFYNPSGALGYHIVLKTNDTYDLYRVNNLQAAPNGCTNLQSQDGWGTWSIRSSNGQTLLGNYAFPANGLIFFDDNVWVNGAINTARLTIAAGRFPDDSTTRRSITINNDLTYTNYDGSDVIGLIAQKNINVGLFSEDDLRIDAAIIAQNGRAGRYYYGDGGSGDTTCGVNANRSVLTLYGMIATNQRYGFAYTNNTGYETRNINYDGNLLYAPPPSFPLAGDTYETISWEEVE